MTKIVLRIDFDETRYIGHGRIDLLELVGTHGSIAKAAKAMNMSYKRAWYLLDAFSACFDEPLVTRQHGGPRGGSAELTPLGRDVVRRYRAMEKSADRVFAKHVEAFEARLSRGKA